MANFNLRKITDNSWIASTNGASIAYIYQSNGEFVYLTMEGEKKFKTMFDLKTFLGGKVNEQIADASSGLDTDALETISGFPVKHTNIVLEQDGTRPVYRRGNTQHVAGYWCIRFSKRWVPSFCPLLNTIEQYQSAGPFKSRLEMMTNLSGFNRQV